MKKTVLLSIVMVLALSMAISGSIAYLSDTDSDVNVMTLGNVDIVQHEMKRAEGVAYNKQDTAKGDLVEFDNYINLYPAYPQADGAYTAGMTEDECFHWGPYVHTGTAWNGLWDDSKLVGAVDKMIFVENTGKSSAYFRTIVAFEMPEGIEIGEASQGAHIMINETGLDLYTKRYVGKVQITETKTQKVNQFAIYEYVYEDALLPGEWSHPSLLQVVMTHNATNKEMELLGESYEVLAVTQAVQTVNFEEAGAVNALNTAFGEITVDNHPWTESGVTMPTLYAYEGVNYVTEGDTVTVSSNGGDTLYRGILSDGQTTATNVVIGEGIIRLNNRSLCKAPTITSVTLPNSLTYIDESVFQQSGVKELEIPENVTYIGKQAMGACGNLEKIIIRANDVTIATYIARACANLKEVYFYSDSVTFESGSMYFTNKESGDASGITFYVKDKAMADNLYNAFSTSHSYGLLIKSLDGATIYYNTLK